MAKNHTRIYQTPAGKTVVDGLPDTTPPGATKTLLKFRELRPNELASAPLIMRIGDVATWNIFGAAFAGGMLWYSVMALRQTLGLRGAVLETETARLLAWNKWHITGYAACVLAAIAIYLVEIRCDDEIRIAGTFYSQSQNALIKDIQVVEGVLCILVILVSYAIAVSAYSVVRKVNKLLDDNDAIGKREFWKTMRRITNFGSFPVFLTLALQMAMRSSLAPAFKAGPNNDWPIVGDISLAGYALEALWYLPFCAVTGLSLLLFLRSPEVKLELKKVSTLLFYFWLERDMPR